MKTLEYTAHITVFSSREELPEELFNLLKQAEDSAKHAYAPYSKFKVGAAILLNNGKIVMGNNQENAVYPSGLCAERTAAFAASAQYPEIPFHVIAITAIHPSTPLNKPVPPCGSCRQVLYEYERKFMQPISLLLAGETGEVYFIKSVSELLPCSFSADFIL